MDLQRAASEPDDPARVDWEAFYRDYRKPGYIPGFEILNKLGGGMFGIVFKARKESIGKDYAVKFLKVDDDSVREAVLREVENVGFFAQVDHPNLVSIEDKGTVDGIPYLVMSYAGEETLQKRLEAGDLDRDRAMSIFAQAARGVQALHDRSLVHFDLKPANIFLKGDVARVGDYGLSKLVSASRNSLSFGRGTPYYMAPELLKRRGDARTDVYSLGVILYETLYGDVPFRGDSEWEVLRKHEQAPVVFPPGALDKDRAVILRCLQKRPEDRYQSAAELLRDLQAPVALGESLVLPRPGDAPPPLPSGQGPAPRQQQQDEAPLANPLQGAGGAESPRGMPWHEDGRAKGPVGQLVSMLFGLLSALTHLAFLPVRAAGKLAGGVAAALVKVIGTTLGVATRLVGLLLLVAIVALVLVTAFSLVSLV